MISPEYLKPIIDELQSNPLPTTNYRQKNSSTKQSTFGVASRRGQPADYTKLCASNPALYKLLLDLGKDYGVGIFTSILVIEGKSSIIRLKTTNGPVTIISFDEDQEGTLTLFADLNRIKGTDTDYTLVYYTAPNSSWLPPPSVVYHNNALVFKRGDNIIQGIVRRSKKTSEGIWIEHKDVAILFP
jgi:hypothetical protein